MRDMILILAVVGVFVYGYFLTAKLGKFLDESREAIEKESEEKEPNGFMLTEKEYHKYLK